MNRFDLTNATSHLLLISLAIDRHFWVNTLRLNELEILGTIFWLYQSAIFRKTAKDDIISKR
ncbi:MAG: hypothetical protein HC820_09830 [Hydrococcus sp. RM1_1_31]|nr:hypothetical protein [Hydrococcus sp. RM1_1_31]